MLSSERYNTRDHRIIIKMIRIKPVEQEVTKILARIIA